MFTLRIKEGTGATGGINIRRVFTSNALVEDGWKSINLNWIRLFERMINTRNHRGSLGRPLAQAPLLTVVLHCINQTLPIPGAPGIGRDIERLRLNVAQTGVGYSRLAGKTLVEIKSKNFTNLRLPEQTQLEPCYARLGYFSAGWACSPSTNFEFADTNKDRAFFCLNVADRYQQPSALLQEPACEPAMITIFVCYFHGTV